MSDRLERETDCNSDGETDEVAEDGGTDRATDLVERREAHEERTKDQRGRRWAKVATYGVLPALVLAITIACGYLKYQQSEAEQAELARIESVRAAVEGSANLLSYTADTVEQDLTVASQRLTGGFRDDYRKLINEVVIPGSRRERITSVANAVAGGADSVTPRHAQVLVFINQTVTVGDGAPTDTASSVKVTLDEIDGRWLIAGFEPV